MSLCEAVSFQSVELPTQEVWGCLYHEITPPTSWCVLLFFFWSRISFLRFLVHSGEECSVFSCEFCGFRREVELQSFCSATLILSHCPSSESCPHYLSACILGKKLKLSVLQFHHKSTYGYNPDVGTRGEKLLSPYINQCLVCHGQQAQDMCHLDSRDGAVKWYKQSNHRCQAEVTVAAGNMLFFSSRIRTQCREREKCPQGKNLVPDQEQNSSFAGSVVVSGAGPGIETPLKWNILIQRIKKYIGNWWIYSSCKKIQT